MHQHKCHVSEHYLGPVLSMRMECRLPSLRSALTGKSNGVLEAD